MTILQFLAKIVTLGVKHVAEYVRKARNSNKPIVRHKEFPQDQFTVRALADHKRADEYLMTPPDLILLWKIGSPQKQPKLIHWLYHKCGSNTQNSIASLFMEYELRVVMSHPYPQACRIEDDLLDQEMPRSKFKIGSVGSLLQQRVCNMFLLLFSWLLFTTKSTDGGAAVVNCIVFNLHSWANYR
ncbi:hypothetical protein NQ317_011412 [Molorchus minor]|uniref:Uncharacterized protein n=1 Tax=Molorchus minor TaxID=1323400 RepID=A0ABQ9JRF7_9CUCU|nr:hypothetical protein NQ317_011412 [Molorchus minor]